VNSGFSSTLPSRIRVATGLDREDIRGVHLRAFPEGENQLVAKLSENLLNEQTAPETISLVAVVGGSVVGHIAFSPVMTETSKDWRGYILAPLGVVPEHQKLGIGTELIESGIELLSKQMTDVLFVYGDPKYYGRFAFSAEAATLFMPPYELTYPFGWQARVLHEGASPGHAAKLSCVVSLRDQALW
jgi:putative acetyltransferase